MITINLENCNNISECKISLKKDSLNIYYAMNGTGKSTIGKSLELLAKDEVLDSLKPFNGDVAPSGILSEKLENVLLFNEEFVNTIVFNKSEVINNAFEVFIKSPKYDELQSSINTKLSKIHFDPETRENLGDLFRVGESVLKKFSLTRTGDLKKVGLMKNLTNSKSIFTLPDKIKKFQSLMSREYKIDWVGSHGPTADGRIKPDVCAQGVDTYCANINGPSSYRVASGTSLSTPLIAGAAAVILSARPYWTPFMIREALMMTADHADNPDNQYGWGVIDIMAAIDYFQLGGDVNEDDILDVLDLVIIVNYILGNDLPTEEQFAIADINDDDLIDVIDLVQLVAIIIGES